MAHPIWQDYILTIALQSGETYADFSVSYSGSLIYEGRAYARPGEATIATKINDICADYLANALPSVFPRAGAEVQPSEFLFTVDVVTENGTESATFVLFLYDWTFDYSRDYTTTPPILTAPILRKIQRTAPLLFTATSDTTPIVRIYNANGERIEEYATAEANNVIDLSAIVVDTDTEVAICDDTEEIVRYKLTDCTRYALYYLNALGGWDMLTIEGKEIQADNYTRHTIGHTYDNNQSRNRGTRNYRNDIVRKWQLRTLWIDDAGAQNMHHLLGSVDVYLYDSREGALYPITINNNQCEYKTYANQGNQLVRYDIEATIATNITRQ